MVFCSNDKKKRNLCCRGKKKGRDLPQKQIPTRHAARKKKFQSSVHPA